MNAATGVRFEIASTRALTTPDQCARRTRSGGTGRGVEGRIRHARLFRLGQLDELRHAAQKTRGKTARTRSDVQDDARTSQCFDGAKKPRLDLVQGDQA